MALRTQLYRGTGKAVLSIVPGIGTALIWVPAVIYLFAIGKVIPAIALLLWCAIVVGLADNFLRPVLVSSDTEMPDLMIMLSTFGGLGLSSAPSASSSARGHRRPVPRHLEDLRRYLQRASRPTRGLP